MTRHPGIENLRSFFEYNHLREGLVRDTSASCAELAEDVLRSLPDSPELTAGLRKLLEAKDCFVRAAVEASMSSSARAEGRDA